MGGPGIHGHLPSSLGQPGQAFLLERRNVKCPRDWGGAGQNCERCGAESLKTSPNFSSSVFLGPLAE